MEDIVTLEPHDYITGIGHSGHRGLVSRRPGGLLSVGTTPEAKRSNQHKHTNKPFHAEFHRGSPRADYIHVDEDIQARHDRLTRQIEGLLPSWSMAFVVKAQQIRSHLRAYTSACASCPRACAG